MLLNDPPCLVFGGGQVVYRDLGFYTQLPAAVGSDTDGSYEGEPKVLGCNIKTLRLKMPKCSVELRGAAGPPDNPLWVSCYTYSFNPLML